MRNRSAFGCILLIVAIIGVLIVSFAIFALFDFLQRKLLLGGEDWLFYEPMPYAQKFMIFPIVILIMEAAMAIVYRITGAKFMESSSTFVKFISEHKVPVIILCVALLYVGFTGISSVDENGVTTRSALNPAGRTYDLELISSVDTGFTRGGEFYYNINVDGKTLKFCAPTVNSWKYPEYYENEYKAFADFDEKLMALGTPKNADVDSINNAEYDESCMKYFRQVVK